MTNRVLVELFYDVLSPYSYIGFENLTKCSKSWNHMNLQLRPMLIGGVMAGSGNTPPGMLPSKSDYMLIDLPRKSKHFGIDFNIPKDITTVLFKTGSLKPQRLLTALKQENHEKLEKVSREIYRKIWVKDEDITEVPSLVQACIDAGIKEAEAKEFVGMITLDGVKKQLKETTDEAISLGAYGAPFYIAHIKSEKIPLFGSDQMYLLADMINEKWESM